MKYTQEQIEYANKMNEELRIKRESSQWYKDQQAIIHAEEEEKEEYRKNHPSKGFETWTMDEISKYNRMAENQE